MPASTESFLGPVSAPAPGSAGAPSAAGDNPLITGPWLQFTVSVQFPNTNGAEALAFAQVWHGAQTKTIFCF